MATKNLKKTTETVEKTEEVRPAKEVKKTYGTVANCQKLNVRKRPIAGADVLGVIDEGDKLEIDMEKSTDEFYKIVTENKLSGYCMRKFIDLAK